MRINSSFFISKNGNANSMDENIRRYAADLARVTILDVETERKLIQQYKKNKNPEAKRKLVESGLRFVVTLAKKYSQNVEQHKALVLAGNEGLVAALDKYELGRGTRLLSYAAWWVLLYIREESHKFNTVTVPIWRRKAVGRVREARDRLVTRTGEAPGVDQIEKLVPFSAVQIKSILDNEYGEISLEEDNTGTPSFPHLKTPSAEAELINKSNAQMLEFVFCQLPARDKFILQAYYGFLTEKPMSLKQISTMLNLSSERIRQIKLEALNHVKENLKAQGIAGLEDLFP